MCGIAGIVSWKRPPDQSTLENMLRRLRHRGPDAQGHQQLGPALFGHRRLSILDVSDAGRQPMSDQSGRYWITYNGEIYNFQEIQADLQARGVVFRSHSDTEVILEGWRVWGADLLQKLVGMFAFGIWDSQEQTLFLARDRLGEKPLYFAPIRPDDFAGGVVFASELPALLCHPEIGREICTDALHQYLSFGYVLTSHCIFKGVYKLPAAHFLEIRQGTGTPAPKLYWDVAPCFHPDQKLDISAQEAGEELRYLLTQSVRGQLVSDVPLGAFLSGGIDSSTVVRCMTDLTPPQQTQTFSIGFREASFDELDDSRLVAQHLGIQHHTDVVDLEAQAILPQVVSAAGEPFADTSMVPTYRLAAFARKHVTVSLSGDGGDELFLGYETYLADRLWHAMSRLPTGFLSILQRVSTFIPTSFQKVSFDYKVKQFFAGCHLPFPQAHLSWRTIFNPMQLRRLGAPAQSQATEGYLAGLFQDVAEAHFLDQASYVDLKTWLVDDILVKVDRMSMAHSLESRAPFLDHRVVEFAARLSPRLKLKGTDKKHILKKAFEKRLLDQTLYKKKAGFNAPVAVWLQDPHFQKFAQETLDALPFNQDYIKSLWQQHIRKEVDNGYRLFTLLCFGLWHQQMARGL